VLRIQEPKIEPPPSITGSSDAAYIQGVINLPDRILILLDLKALFGDDAKVVDKAA
jgi:chemotaxis signal transduction protein